MPYQRTLASGGQPTDQDLTDIAALSPSNDDVIQRKSGAWTNRTPAQVKTDLALAKGDVGLGSVDNTADIAKPVSTATQAALDAKLSRWTLPTGAVAQTFPRNQKTESLGASLTSGTLALVGIDLLAGQVISTITFFSGGTALSSGSNQWFALYSSARALLGVTNDHTSTAWGTETAKTLTLASPYTVLTSGMYYLGICVVASTVPTLRGALSTATVTAVAPVLSGASTASLTNPASAPATAAAITAGTTIPYAYAA